MLLTDHVMQVRVHEAHVQPVLEPQLGTAGAPVEAQREAIGVVRRRQPVGHRTADEDAVAGLIGPVGPGAPDGVVAVRPRRPAAGPAA